MTINQSLKELAELMIQTDTSFVTKEIIIGKKKVYLQISMKDKRI